MKIAIMQPYFLPYIGYFQLMNSVDKFIIYDDIQYTKKGWINRNRLRNNNEDFVISLPIKKAAHELSINQRIISENWITHREKLLRQILLWYERAPYFDSTMPIVESILRHEDLNLFNFLHKSLVELSKFMKINTPIIQSSKIPYNRRLKAQDMVIDICKKVDCTEYINAIGGVELYDKTVFQKRQISLKFIKSHPFEYNQFSSHFIPWLSIVDVLMFNDVKAVKRFINNYSLI